MEDFSHLQISIYHCPHTNLRSNQMSGCHLTNPQEPLHAYQFSAGTWGACHQIVINAFLNGFEVAHVMWFASRKLTGSSPSTWTTEHYHAVHSGDTTSHAGLLTLISKKLLKAESLSWTERVPGRLVQLKLRGRSQDLDLIHCYQHVHKPAKMDDRDVFWTELQSTLTSLPTRNRCCVLGDFNTTIPVANAKVGHKDFLHQGVRQIGPNHKDWKSLSSSSGTV